MNHSLLMIFYIKYLFIHIHFLIMIKSNNFLFGILIILFLFQITYSQSGADDLVLLPIPGYN
jgi:hypothetical protein